jgi:hypothetical protein
MKSPARPTAAGLARRRRFAKFARAGTIWETASRKYKRSKGTQTLAGAPLLGPDTINDAAGFATQQNLREVLQLPLRFGRLGPLTARP